MNPEYFISPTDFDFSSDCTVPIITNLYDVNYNKINNSIACQNNGIFDYFESPVLREINIDELKNIESNSLCDPNINSSENPCLNDGGCTGIMCLGILWIGIILVVTSGLCVALVFIYRAYTKW